MKILEAFGEPLSYGGQEAFIMNALPHIDSREMEIDLLSPYYCDNESIVRKVNLRGGKVYTLNCSFAPGRGRWTEIRPIREFLSNHQYDVIHIHSGSCSMLAIYSWLARQTGIPYTIVHSHCAGRNNLKHVISKTLMSHILDRCPDEYCACSKEAGNWMFSQTVCKNRLQIIYNGIEVEDFTYDSDKRRAVRDDLGINSDTVVIGIVGRLSAEKNQTFLLDIMSRIVNCRNKYSKEYKLLVVGGGKDIGILREKVDELGISNDVIFTGPKSNVCDYYQAMDVLAVPSLYEGLGIAVIEGQATGLDVLASDRIPCIVDVTGNVSFLSLENENAWIEAVSEEHVRHHGSCEAIERSRFNAIRAASALEKMYMSKPYIRGFTTR